MEVKMAQVGEVIIDTGRLLVGDPCHVADNPDACVIHSTVIGDGVYPVFELELAGVKFLAVQIDKLGVDMQELFKGAQFNER